MASLPLPAAVSSSSSSSSSSSLSGKDSKPDTAPSTSTPSQQSAIASGFYRAPQLLEINEELISACVENLQLGRLDECIKHYTQLQRNITTLGLEVDNFPLSIHEDPERAMITFPDKIIRKDILDELRAPDSALGMAVQAEAPLPPPCHECIAPYVASNRSKRYLAYRCRVERGHTNPSYKFTANERNEFLAVAELLEERQRQLGQQSNASKRNYKRWSADEKHTILIVSTLFGLKHQSKLSGFLVNRNENQIRSFINKKLDPIELTAIATGMKPLPPPPKGYIPPQKLLEELKRRSDVGEDVSTIRDSFSNSNNIKMPHSESLSKSDNFVSMSSTLQKENTAASVYTGETMSQMAATSGGGWSRMLSVAAGDRQPYEQVVISESDESGDEKEEDEDDDSVDVVVNGKKRKGKRVKSAHNGVGVGSALASESSGVHEKAAMKPVPSQGRLKDKYGDIAPVNTQRRRQQQQQQGSHSPPLVPAQASTAGSSSTGIAAEARIKILSDTIKILGSKLESASSTQTPAAFTSSQVVHKVDESIKKKVSGTKQSASKSSKTSKSADKKAAKEKLKIETGGRRGAAKFDQLFGYHEAEGSIYSEGTGTGFICEDSNSGLLDPSLPLADGADILQSPTKLQFQVPSVNIASSGGNHMFSPNASAKKKTGTTRNKKNAASNQPIAANLNIASPQESLQGLPPDVTAEFSQFSIPHVTSDSPMHLMGEQTMDSFSLLPHGADEFSML